GRWGDSSVASTSTVTVRAATNIRALAVSAVLAEQRVKVELGMCSGGHAGDVGRGFAATSIVLANDNRDDDDMVAGGGCWASALSSPVAPGVEALIGIKSTLDDPHGVLSNWDDFGP
ncbi:hypothetical protein Dimus_029115, partial [Dionaea muscipula]